MKTILAFLILCTGLAHAQMGPSVLPMPQGPQPPSLLPLWQQGPQYSLLNPSQQVAPGMMPYQQNMFINPAIGYSGYGYGGYNPYMMSGYGQNMNMGGYPPYMGMGGQGFGLNLNFGSGGGFGSMLSGLGGMFSSLFSGIGNAFSDMGFSGCVSCDSNMGGSRTPGPIRVSPAPPVAGPSFHGTEAGFMGTNADVPGGDRIASTDPNPPAIAGPAITRPGVGTPAPEILPMGHVDQESEARSSPIWPAFIAAFRQCAPGCEPAQYAAYGQRNGKSCHETSEAIDVHGMICGGEVHMAINKGKFEDMVGCMRGKMRGVLYFNGPDETTGHRNHAHFSNGCLGGTYL